MINSNDKVLGVRLYTSHDTDYVCETPEGMVYLFQKRKDDKNYHHLYPNPTQETNWIIGDEISI